MNRQLLSILLTCAVLFTSCGYKFGYGSYAENYSTISVPYIAGDQQGVLTAQLVKVLSESGAFEYRKDGGELLLNVSIASHRGEHIGYRFDTDANGNTVNRIVPSEGRKEVLAEVTLVEAASGKVLFGPKRFAAKADYDFDPDSAQDNLTSFSLAQLNNNDAATDVAQEPLGRNLAKKIVQHLTNAW